jgi:TonB family protein
MANPRLEPTQDASASSAGTVAEASDIIELVVLSQDEHFLDTLKEAVGQSRRVWEVPSSEQVSDLLVAGGVGIFVLDLRTLAGNAAVFIQEIKRQFPDLVLVAAGAREDEMALAAWISSGAIYRFIHKPVSPGRAKLFADAAIRRSIELKRRTAVGAAFGPPAVRPAGLSKPVMIGAGALAALIVVSGLWYALRREPGLAPAPPLPSPVAAQAESPLLRKASAALAADRLVEPPGDNAFELYSDALAQSPDDAAAKWGLAQVTDKLLGRVENALLAEKLDDAERALGAAKKAKIDTPRLALLTAELAKRREQKSAAAAQLKTDADRQRAATALQEILRNANDRLSEGRLLEPAGDSARDYVLRAKAQAPGDERAGAIAGKLSARLLQDARTALAARDLPKAERLINASKEFSGEPDINAALKDLAAARDRRDTDDRANILRLAQERIQQDRLIDPPTDSAKYFLLSLRTQDPNFPGLARAVQSLGSLLLEKARRAHDAKQWSAAQKFVQEATAVGYSSPELAALGSQIQASSDKERFLDNVMLIQDLSPVRRAEPEYPPNAFRKSLQGWVELDFTVARDGSVKDIAVHESDPREVFDRAAIDAMKKWKFKPVVREGVAIDQRGRVRFRFKTD